MVGKYRRHKPCQRNGSLDCFSFRFCFFSFAFRLYGSAKEVKWQKISELEIDDTVICVHAINKHKLKISYAVRKFPGLPPSMKLTSLSIFAQIYHIPFEAHPS